MARKPRQKAASGIYLVTARAKNHPLFGEDPDGRFFLELLAAEKNRDAAEIFAYCLLNDALYLVFKEGLSGVSKGIMRILSLYASYYNEKYGLDGKLFYDRFGSKPLETTPEILEATRFTHRLPLTLRLPFSYEWSSYRSYFNPPEFLSSKEIIALIGSGVDYKLFCEND